ncbi:MAG: DUF6348 family protein [Deferribacteraceae bacterium]|jgi:hypothetical protein|nr:DUF6348 family protein [Deferribacteraceae bacterium]
MRFRQLTDSLQYILTDINNKIRGSIIDGDSLVIPDLSLYIRIVSSNVEEKDGNFFLSFHVSLSHPSFYEDAVEAYFPTQAKTFETALQQGVRTFLVGLMQNVFNCIQAQEDYTFNTSFLGSKKSWDVYEGDLLLFNRNDGQSLWNSIQGALVRRLGNRPFYYIDAFVGELEDGEITAKCGINSESSHELAQLLIKNTDKCGSPGYVRQFFLLQQTGSYDGYPYKRAAIERFTERALSLFGYCCTEESYKNLLTSLYKVTEDIDLACELKSFLPEICAEAFYRDKGVSFSETVVLIRGSEEITVYKDQFTSYNWIKDRILRAFESAEFSSGLFNRLISISATHNAIVKAKKEGEGYGFIVQTALNVPSTYELR